MADLNEIEAQLGTLGTRVREIGDEIKTLVEDQSTEGKARYDELTAEQTKIMEQVAPLLADKEKAEAAVLAKSNQNKLEALLSASRSASKAGLIGAGVSAYNDPEYTAGAFIGAIADLRSGDPELFGEAKATLNEISSHQESWGKATLGTSDATGGWIIPNAIVEDIIKPATFRNPYRELMTVVPGVTAAAVDQPFRSAAPARAVIAAAGATKENVDLVYNGYTVTMYTLARIHDIGNQFLRTSRGAAERDVMQELATAFALGEAFYIREGTGSSQPFGYTSALTNGPGTFRSTFTPSASTLAGSILTAIATAAGALAGRGRTPTGAVLAATTYWTMASQGLDGTGFFYAPAAGPRDIRPGTLLTPWGLPVFPDAAADNEGTAAVIDNLVVAEWTTFKVYFGESYRVDSSSVAGTRWDTNVTGFRGEEEMGFDARAAVYAGAAQMITDVLP
jgi:HK97 family phage major capsid protein